MTKVQRFRGAIEIRRIRMSTTRTQTALYGHLRGPASTVSTLSTGPALGFSGGGGNAPLLGSAQAMTEDGPAGKPDPAHRRPAGVDDATVDALGRFSKALEIIHRARGHLYTVHQLTGSADFELDGAVEMFRQAGHHEWADRIERELIGRNVIEGRWTFQLVEEYDDGYYATFQDLERQAREELAEGRRHLYEAELKQQRRTPGLPGHETAP
ncbi:hypothetical protein [Streptosporangium sandarakinum]|uniref:hypothetical protein n=1 Tax=Streptosporangium sandarakinum TaxID=1260955 RepID=UPI0037198FF9